MISIIRFFILTIVSCLILSLCWYLISFVLFVRFKTSNFSKYFSIEIYPYFTPVELLVSLPGISINTMQLKKIFMEKFDGNIPRLREYRFTDCLTLTFFSSFRFAFPTGKHPHNCMISIYPKKTKEEEKFIHIDNLVFRCRKVNTIRKERKEEEEE